nr:MAG TPA: hypothetical protein [Caudoviricetes sp.]
MPIERFATPSGRLSKSILRLRLSDDILRNCHGIFLPKDTVGNRLLTPKQVIWSFYQHYFCITSRTPEVSY